MASIVKRLASGVLAAWFTVFSVVFPVTAHAVTYNAASNFTGRSWYVPAVGTGIAGTRVLASAATIAGRANPWIAGLTIGTAIVEHLFDLSPASSPVTPSGAALPTTAGFAPSPETLPTPPGWSGPNSPPGTSPVIPGGASNPSTATVPATERWLDLSHNIYSDTALDACKTLWPTYTIVGVDYVGDIAWCNTKIGTQVINRNGYVLSLIHI